MPIYKIIQEIMEERQLKVADVARMCDLPDSTVRGIITRKQATVSLEVAFKLSDGLGVSLCRLNDMPEERPRKIENAPLCSSEAMQLARDYDGLDVWGRRAVRHTADLEMARVQEQDAKWADDEPIDPGKILPLFRSPAAAGYASPIMGEDYDDYELRPGDPPGAAFAVRVSGDSMEPAFSDGDIAFCDRAPMQDGDIGVFYLGGDMFIKQYHYDPATKMTYLFSLNRKRADADKLVTVSMQDRFACMGHVIVPRRYPLPGV